MKKIVALLLAGMFLAHAPLFSQAESKQETKPAPSAQDTANTAGNAVTTPSGLKYQDITVGTGESPVKGRKVTVHYTGWLEEGTKFASSRDDNEPLVFPIGVGRVIKGWDEGIATMKVGGRRKLTIHPALGYGSRGYPPLIPANATLIFDVELLGAEK